MTTLPLMRRFSIAAWLFLSVSGLSAEDVIELKTGAKSRGRVVSQEGDEVTIEVTIGSRKFIRKYPKSRVAAVTINGTRSTLEGGSPTSSAAPAGGVSGSQDERSVREQISQIGRTPPDWYDSTPLNYPDTLDLTWPEASAQALEQPEKRWPIHLGSYQPQSPANGKKGVKLMHHIMAIAAG